MTLSLSLCWTPWEQLQEYRWVSILIVSKYAKSQLKSSKRFHKIQCNPTDTTRDLLVKYTLRISWNLRNWSKNVMRSVSTNLFRKNPIFCSRKCAKTSWRPQNKSRKYTVYVAWWFQNTLRTSWKRSFKAKTLFLEKVWPNLPSF